jgi:hypothetical protein
MANGKTISPHFFGKRGDNNNNNKKTIDIHSQITLGKFPQPPYVFSKKAFLLCLFSLVKWLIDVKRLDTTAEGLHSRTYIQSSSS